MTASASVKSALVTVLRGLFPDPVLVVYGDPGTNLPDSIISVGNVRSIYERPVSGTNRPREQIGEVDVIFSEFAFGDETVQQSVTETAYAKLGQLADYFKTKPNETLGGACREAWVLRDELAESVAYDTESDPPAPIGRLAEITATVQFKQRV